MDDTDGGLSFDFEGGLDAAGGVGLAATNPPTTTTNPSSLPSTLIQSDNNSTPITAAINNNNNPSGEIQQGGGRRSFRQTVCRHWLRSLCMKGDACGFLHQFDKARMPVCRFFRLYGECREQDCVYKHTTEDIKECNMYKLGFCPNGPDCRYRHAKLPGPPPSVEEVLQKIQQLTAYNNYNNNNKYFTPRGPGFPQQADRNQASQGNQNSGIRPLTTESAANVQQNQMQQPQQQASQNQIQNPANGVPNQANRSATALPPGISRYFIVKSCNRENLELSVQQGVWATQRSNEAKLNEAFDSAENVILIFSVNRTRHFQGCAKMTSRIGGSNAGGNWKHAHGTAHYGRSFSVKWLKLCELSFQKTRHLRNPYNENLPVKLGQMRDYDLRISRDCQEMEPSVGEQLASLLYVEPDSELMAISIAAESKREEEKAKGVDPDNNGSENPDIVLFEDNEEEEEEESDEEDESFMAATQGRGRGRGMMWPPHMPLARGARPMPGMRGFPPMMMGADGFSYGPDGFPMPDLFNVAHRGFAPFGPRFPGDFNGPPSGMMFPGRPPQPFPGGGFGMMMGPGRGPFMGGMGPTGANPARSGRPMFPPGPPLPPGQNPGRNNSKRDPRALVSDRNERYSVGSDQGRGQDDDTGSRQEGKDEFGGGNTFRNDESDSEDEAPRRSRHGEGKKKRRSLEQDPNPGSDH
ncbi:hypothetical protein ACFE04_000710 [Oxalis oulophora]